MQRALDVAVAVEVAVEVKVEEQKVPACLQVFPEQQGPLAEPQSVQVPALTAYVSHTAAGSVHLVVGDVLVELQHVWPVAPHAWHLYEDDVLS